eukprot:TRINITY_DN29494_c0_g1_i1.p1 TRINITY_DN29494_c0_g1~~TRINITY_DN29494_c0_g1_i1.p1  ORF type:complete len:259 (-),score=59.59 TRINITY_DN29494_c0_g1_i1:254-1030(-)
MTSCLLRPLVVLFTALGVQTDSAPVADSSAEEQPLIFAAGNGDLSQVEQLLASGANVNERNAAMETPLHVAGISCADGVVEALLSARADVHARANDGDGLSMTPLHWYANMPPCKVHHVRLLLEAQADPAVQNTRGETPLDMISELPGRADVATLLRKRLGLDADVGASEQHNDINEEEDGMLSHTGNGNIASDWDEVFRDLGDDARVANLKAAFEAAGGSTDTLDEMLENLSDLDELEDLKSAVEAASANLSDWDEL